MDNKRLASELVRLARELIGESEYKVTVETLEYEYQSNVKSEVIEEEIFDDKNKAKDFIKKMIKKYDLVRHAGHLVNYKDGYELFTNF